MSINDVTTRISQIQSQLALLAPRTTTAPTGFAPADGTTDFSSVLARASTDPVAAAGTGMTDSMGGDVLSPGYIEGQMVVAEAKKYLGLPYVWGGTDPEKGMDCSGLVQVVYKKLGYDLPRVSYQQAASGTPVASMDQAKPGDLIAWDNSSRNNGVDHIAIYIGDGKMIEAPRTGLDIRIIDVPSTPDVIRRIIPDQPSARTLPVAPTAQPVGALTERTPYADLFRSAGVKHGVPPALLAAVAKQESGFDASAVSPAGAQGLMQIMPGTARELGVDALVPAQAVDGAARYLSDMIARFGSTELALAGYNAGPGAVMRYDGIPPYAETRNYVTSVMSMLGGAR